MFEVVVKSSIWIVICMKFCLGTEGVIYELVCSVILFREMVFTCGGRGCGMNIVFFNKVIEVAVEAWRLTCNRDKCSRYYCWL